MSTERKITEDEYTWVTNKSHLMAILDNLKHILPGKEWGVSEVEYKKLFIQADNMFQKCIKFKDVEI